MRKKISEEYVDLGDRIILHESRWKAMLNQKNWKEDTFIVVFSTTVVGIVGVIISFFM